MNSASQNTSRFYDRLKKTKIEVQAILHRFRAFAMQDTEKMLLNTIEKKGMMELINSKLKDWLGILDTVSSQSDGPEESSKSGGQGSDRFTAARKSPRPTAGTLSSVQLSMSDLKFRDVHSGLLHRYEGLHCVAGRNQL